MHPNLFKGELMGSYKRNKNMADYLVSPNLNYASWETSHTSYPRSKSPKSAKGGDLPQFSSIQEYSIQMRRIIWVNGYFLGKASS